MVHGTHVVHTVQVLHGLAAAYGSAEAKHPSYFPVLDNVN